MTTFDGIAEFERDLIREHAGAGRVDARKRGVRFGPPEEDEGRQIKLARRLLKEEISVAEVTGPSASTTQPFTESLRQQLESRTAELVRPDCPQGQQCESIPRRQLQPSAASVKQSSFEDWLRPRPELASRNFRPMIPKIRSSVLLVMLIITAEAPVVLRPENVALQQ